VWYRAAGETEWRTGLTRSVSTTEVLIRADLHGVPSEPITVTIQLPTAGGCLVGHGRIARIVDEPAEGPATFAVAVPHYRLDRCHVALGR
jgi:hypothetical protein